jgi:hypothetical protein
MGPLLVLRCSPRNAEHGPKPPSPSRWEKCLTSVLRDSQLGYQDSPLLTPPFQQGRGYAAARCYVEASTASLAPGDSVMIMGEESLRGCTGFISEVKGDSLLVAVRKQEAHSEPRGANRGEEQRLRQLIAQVFELEYAPLAGGYRKGDRVTSRIALRATFCQISKGEMGTVVGPCCDERVQDKADRVCVDFGKDKGLINFKVNFLLHQQAAGVDAISCCVVPSACLSLLALARPC